MKRKQTFPFRISLFLQGLFLLTATAAAQQIPVVVNQTGDAKVMLILDDSGSMNAVMEHQDFDAEDPAVNNAANKIPSVIFRLESGAAAPSTNQDLTPVIFEMNWGLWNYSGGNVYASRRFSQASNMNFISGVGCTNSNGNLVWCPGGSPNAYYGIGVFQLYDSPSVKGSSVFSLSNLAEDAGVDVTDASGNEYLYADYRQNDYVRQGRDWHGIWAEFDADGDPVVVNTRAYVTLGGTVVFNGKEIFLSAGWYREEYLRWIFYEATAAQLATLPGATRMETVKDVVEDLIINNPSVSFGLATLNGSTYNPGSHNSGSYGQQMWTPEGDAQVGGQPKIRAEIGTDTATLISKLQGITSYGGTPLANTYIEALRYFAGESDRDPYCNNCSYDSPIDSECDASFVILLTDGLPSSETHNMVKDTWIYDFDGDGDEGTNRNKNCSDETCSKFLDDASFYAFNNDFNNNLEGLQNIRSYAVGLGLDFSLLNDFAANGGSGQALRADTADEITTALSDIVGNLVTTAVGAAGVAVAEVFGEEGQVFRPRFEASHWTGNIDKYVAVDGELIKVFDIGKLLENRSLNTSPRTIYTAIDADNDGNTVTMTEFSFGNANDLKTHLFKLYYDGALNSSLLASPIKQYTKKSSAETLIQYIHGYDFEDMRTRDSNGDGNVEKLGDIVYSRPRYVGHRNGKYSGMAGYTDYVRSLSDEPHLLLAGANDGMLHAFNAATGEELWSFIPSSLLKYLEVLARPSYANEYHRYYVNGQVSIEDVYYDGNWKTIAIFGLGEGGESWTALDITDRSSPQLLFEVSDSSNGGQSWNEATVVANGAAANSNNPADFSWYIVVPSGEEKPTAGNNLLVYKLQNTGAAPSATIIPVEAAADAGTRLTSFLPVQNDQDLNVDRGYVGSESGDLYRVTTNGAPADWNVAKLYDGLATHPITARPTAVLVDNPNYVDGGAGTAQYQYAIGVYFGSGRYDTTSDVTTVGATSQTIVGIFDPVNIQSDAYANLQSTLARSDLENQSIGSFDPEKKADKIYRLDTAKKGFYIDLDTSITLVDQHYIRPVGMVTHPPINVRGNIIFSTFLPNQDECSAGGHGFIQGVNFRSAGGSVVDYFIDSNDPFFNGGIQDIDGDGDTDADDLQSGYNQGVTLPVLDTYVESVDLSLSRPYEYDGQLSVNDIWLDTVSGGSKPVVSSLGANGVPGPPSVLYQDGQIIIQSAYLSQNTGDDGDDEEEEAQVTICHYPDGPAVVETRETMSVPESELQSYLDNGDTVGACPETGNGKKITICHYPPGNPANMHTISISINAWPAHEAHNDTQGACNDDGGGDDDDDDDDEEPVEKPEQVPVNLYNQPVDILSFHESTGE